MSLDCKVLLSMVGVFIVIDLNVCFGVGVGVGLKDEGGVR